MGGKFGHKKVPPLFNHPTHPWFNHLGMAPAKAIGSSETLLPTFTLKSEQRSVTSSITITVRLPVIHGVEGGLQQWQKMRRGSSAILVCKSADKRGGQSESVCIVANVTRGWRPPAPNRSPSSSTANPPASIEAQPLGFRQKY